jgi:hypothetical protein
MACPPVDSWSQCQGFGVQNGQRDVAQAVGSGVFIKR